MTKSEKRLKGFWKSCQLGRRREPRALTTRARNLLTKRSGKR